MNLPIIASLFSLMGFIRAQAPTPTQRKHLFHLVLSLGFIITLLFSYPLWTSNRPFPLAPVWGGDLGIHLPGNLLIFLLLGSASISLFVPRRDLSAGLTALLCIWAMAEDVNRAHPWMIYFTLGWATLAVSHQKDIQFSNLLRILTVFIYFWSGFHKINPNFFEYAWPYLAEGLLGSKIEGTIWMQLGYAVPVIESGLAMALFFPKSRKWAVLLLITMHLGILVSIGPTGQNWNLVVWPWNAIMIANLYFLFAKEKSWMPVIKVQKWWYSNLVILVFGLLPCLHIFHLWPPYLSWSIYSMKQSELLITVDKEGFDCLPKELQNAKAEPGEGGLMTYYLLDWSTKSLKTPHFPHSLVYDAVSKELCNCNSPGYLEIVERERHWKHWENEFYPCE